MACEGCVNLEVRLRMCEEEIRLLRSVLREKSEPLPQPKERSTSSPTVTAIPNFCALVASYSVLIHRLQSSEDHRSGTPRVCKTKEEIESNSSKNRCPVTDISIFVGGTDKIKKRKINAGGHSRLVAAMAKAKALFIIAVVSFITTVVVDYVIFSPENLRIGLTAFLVKSLCPSRYCSAGPMNQTILGVDRAKYDFLINGSVNCSKPWVSITNDGRLGNKMCSLYHVYHIKYTYGMQAGLSPDMWESLRNIFPHLSLKPLPPECIDQMNKLKAIHHRDAFPLLEREGGTRNVLIGGMPCNMAKLWYLREVFIDEFRFSTSVIKKAQKRLASLLATWRKRMLTHLPSNTQLSDDVTVVGVHARRTDYKKYVMDKYKGKVLNKHYFKVAFARARQMFGLTAFVVMSDDLTWCRENLMDEHGDVVVPTSNDLPQVDMALLSLCDHVIVSVGTYGTSGGLLSGGKFFYPVRDFFKNETVYGLQSTPGISKLTDVVPVWYDHTKE